MRVLILGNTNNKGVLLASTLRKLGHQAHCVLTLDREASPDFHLHDANADLIYSYRASSWLSRKTAFARRTLTLGRYQVLHATSGLGSSPDIAFWVRRGRKLFIYYNGDDLLQWRDVWGQELATGLFVTTPDMLDMERDYPLRYQPNPLPVSDYPLLPKRRRAKDELPRVVHANGSDPRMQAKKGTPAILAALRELEAEGRLELHYVEDTPHKEALGLYRECDLAVDQLENGWYGYFGMELMMMGKPVLTWKREDLPPNPLLPLDKSNIKASVCDLLDREDEWEAIGRQQREYVIREHNPEKVAREWLNHYRAALDQAG